VAGPFDVQAAERITMHWARGYGLTQNRRYKNPLTRARVLRSYQDSLESSRAAPAHNASNSWL
jgi:hypothetical protein